MSMSPVLPCIHITLSVVPMVGAKGVKAIREDVYSHMLNVLGGFMSSV